jgi:hypothetical protein
MMKPTRTSAQRAHRLVWAVYVSVMVLGLLGLSVGVAGCGGGSTTSGRALPSPAEHWITPAERIPGVSQKILGSGARSTVVLWRSGRPMSRRVVLFFHGYGYLALPPSRYAGWLRHLIDEGNTVIYPVYQGRRTPPSQYGTNALAGIEKGVHFVHPEPSRLVAIGHTTGGALAFDYAAVARERGLPAPHAVYSVYPGRKPTVGRPIPPQDLRQIPPSTLLEVVAGPADPIPGGEVTARSLLSDATQVPSAHRHLMLAPYKRPPAGLSFDVEPRRSYWAPADRLIAEARDAAKSDR